MPPEDEAAEAAAQEGKRRGRKRGKHNFEPGYKDQLFDDWIAFTKKHRRCPKVEEVKELSEIAFEKRRSALKAEDANHPHLSILEAPLDPVQVKNLVNNEKRRRSKLVSHYPADEQDGAEEDDYEQKGEDASWPSQSLVAKGMKEGAAGFAPLTKKKKKRKYTGGYSMAESEADSHSTVAAAAAGLAGLDAAAEVQRAIFGPGGNSGAGASGSAGGSSGGAAGSPPDHILSAALSACQQVLQAQQSSPGSGLDLQLLQDSLKHALAAQLQQMSPSQQLALWQIQQQQQQQL
mmetsp:Transcript_1282/g.3674  ORF Transcript_1282/g.3674 Transcript_1282/m.3674 type:complete len:291 (+) Transcript_1282:96-968(+)